MAKRLIKEGITVVRDGKRVRPEIGKLFDLTADEIKQIERVRPQAIAKLNDVQEDTRSVPTEPSDAVDQRALADMDRDELADLASSMDIQFAKNAGKGKLIELIEAARASAEL